MTRPIPPIQPPAWREPERARTLSLEIDVITPLFGGSAEPREVDSAHPVRAASVRGHLRFWWRATAGARYGSAAELRDAEARLWGGQCRDPENPGQPCSRHGRVALRVEVLDSGKPKSCSEIAGNARPRTGPRAGYFLFPFQEQKAENEQESLPEAKGLVGVRFRLEIDCPEQDRPQVEQALRAWLAFGGIGARTRRGLGALRAPESWLPPSLPDVRWFGPLPQPHSAARHPRLPGATLLLGPEEQDPRAAWEKLGTFWARFRKGHFHESGYSPMSGCRWQDLRILTKTRHRPPSALPLAKPYLGLPIIYQKFSDVPYAPRLEAKTTGRMASPIILKPMAVKGRRVRPAILILEAPRPDAIRIDGGKPVQLTVPVDDPVLQDLDARDPIEAVIRAASRVMQVQHLQF